LRAIAARASMCAAVVPQQPPTRFSHPSLLNLSSVEAKTAGVSRYLPCSSGSPAFGTQATRVRAYRESDLKWSLMKAGPVEQLRPR